MDNFKQSFDLFFDSFSNQGNVNSLLIAGCFSIDALKTLRNLYEKRILFDTRFVKIDFSESAIPDTYRVLFEIIKVNHIELGVSAQKIKDFSKSQILQGVANILEKENAKLKYNQRYAEKYLSGNHTYLEIERQATYTTKVGIPFQELLKLFFLNAPEQDLINIVHNQEIECIFSDLLYKCWDYSQIVDTVERHLYFNWGFEIVDNKYLKTSPPLEQREGLSKFDLVNSLKNRFFVENIDKIAKQNFIENSIKTIKEGAKPKEYWKYTPSSEEDKQWFAKAYFIASQADIDVETQLAVISSKYFPSISSLENLPLKGENNLPLRDTFNILGFISEFSKEYIKSNDIHYINAVAEYSQKYPISQEGKDIDMLLGMTKGDKSWAKEILENHYNNEVREEQTKIINFAKSKINDSDCLIRMDYARLVETLQWVYQYEADFIKQVIELFVFNDGNNSITRFPFFKIGNDICWLPNMVAYVSWAENLIENLLSRKVIDIHKMQTNYFEKTLNTFFAKYGYKIINDASKKIRDNITNKEIGDFDVLAYKDGALICMELKITHTRNSYSERKTWRDKKLLEAKKQLDTVTQYIKDNPEYISKILGLTESEKIESVAPFIVSNSLLFDHEKIDGYLKIGYFEAMCALMSIENHWKRPNKVEAYIDMIQNNDFFKSYESIPKSIDGCCKIGDYGIIMPSVMQQNIYAV
jgi:hypothetical protein